MILAQKDGKRYWIRWTGKKWIDKAGHPWRIDGLDLFSPNHGSVRDWRADVFEVQEQHQEAA